MIRMGSPQADQQLGELIATFTRLLADLRDLQADGGPHERALLMAPTLEDHRIVPSLQPVLCGICFDHPLLGGPRITTSPLIALGPSWARTWSRYYRLLDSGAA